MFLFLHWFFFLHTTDDRYCIDNGAMIAYTGVSLYACNVYTGVSLHVCNVYTGVPWLVCAVPPGVCRTVITVTVWTRAPLCAIIADNGVSPSMRTLVCLRALFTLLSIHRGKYLNPKP